LDWIELIKYQIFIHGIKITIKLIYSCWANLTNFTKSHTNTSLFNANLINACTHIQALEGYMEAQEWIQYPKTFKYFRIVSLFELSTSILTFKGRYSTKTRFVGKNIRIQRVFTFLNNLFPFLLINLASLWNSMNFFELSVKKTNNIYKIPSNQHTRYNSNKMTLPNLSYVQNNGSPMRKGVTFSFNYNVTLVWWPWNTLFPSQPMLTSLTSNSILEFLFFQANQVD
jgi:hypothetical protein